MQNAEIWKSIETLCDEAESVIKNREPEITVIQSNQAPALAKQKTPSKSTLKVLSSSPAPPRANIVDRPTPQKDAAEAPLSPATMTDIAAAIDRATQNVKKPQIIEQKSQEVSDQFRKDLMIEVSLAVRSVLANELPKMVHDAISESLYELINSSANSPANSLEALEAKPKLKGETKKITTKKNDFPKSLAGIEKMSKLELEDLGRKYGVELDRRYKKSTLVKQIKNIILLSNMGE